MTALYAVAPADVVTSGAQSVCAQLVSSAFSSSGQSRTHSRASAQSPIPEHVAISAEHAPPMHSAHSVSPNVAPLLPLPPPEHAAPARTAAAIATNATNDPRILLMAEEYYGRRRVTLPA